MKNIKYWKIESVSYIATWNSMVTLSNNNVTLYRFECVSANIKMIFDDAQWDCSSVYQQLLDYTGEGNNEGERPANCKCVFNENLTPTERTNLVVRDIATKWFSLRSLSFTIKQVRWFPVVSPRLLLTQTGDLTPLSTLRLRRHC